MPLLYYRAVGNGGRGGHRFGRYVNPIFITGANYAPPHYYSPRIVRPSYGPELYSINVIFKRILCNLINLKVPLCVVMRKDIHNSNKNFCASKLCTFRDKVAFIQANELDTVKDFLIEFDMKPCMHLNMDFIRSHFGKMHLCPVEPFFLHFDSRSVLIWNQSEEKRGASFRSDFL